jgi:ribosomal protein S18
VEPDYKDVRIISRYIQSGVKLFPGVSPE